MLIFLESGGLGEHRATFKFLVLGYGKKSDFRGGTPNLCIDNLSITLKEAKNLDKLGTIRLLGPGGTLGCLPDPSPI